MKQYVSKFSGKELDERLTRVDDIPTKTSELNNDSGFISEIDADNKYTDKNKTDVLERDLKDLKDKIDGEIPTKISQLENDKNYITSLDIQNKADLDNGKIIVSQLPDYILGQVMYGGVITSGDSLNINVQTSINYQNKYNVSQNATINKYQFWSQTGVYLISGANGTFLDKEVKVGDWLISTGSSVAKVDNTDAVSSVAGLTGSINASALAGKLAEITDSNSLARKTDVPKKLSELEIDVEIGGDGYVGVYGDGYIESQIMEDGTYLTTNVAENLDVVSARGQLADAYDIKTYINDNIGDSEYISVITDKTLTTPNAVGGIAKGTKVSDLEGKTFSEMFDDLLFPTVNPEFTAPTASIAFKSYSSTQEVGAIGPKSANFTTGYNAGEIKLNGVKQANRGGTLNSTNSFIYVNGSSSNKNLPIIVPLGNTTFKYRAAYNQGPQPKNNKGGNYDSPLAAGTVDSSAITLNGTYPWYASTSAATSTNPVVKQSLVAWNATAGKMSTGQFTVQPSGTLPQVFKLPRKIDVLQLKNALNGNMENVEEINGVPKDYTESTETINIGGTNVTYYVYTYSGSTRGSVTLLAKF